MNKLEAVAFLGIGKRTLERYTSEGKIKVSYKSQDGQRLEAQYDLDDLKQLKSQLNSEVLPPLEPSIETINQVPQLGFMMLSFVEEIKQIADYTRFEQLTKKLTLNLSEASQLTGITEFMLRKAIKSGELKSKKIGRGYKLTAKDLQTWINQKFE